MVQGLHAHSRVPSAESAEELRDLTRNINQEVVFGVEEEGYPARVPSAKDDMELNELLNLNPSIYDLTVQYSCLASHRCGGKAGFPSLLMIVGLEVINIFAQMSILVEVDKLIANPAKEKANGLYRMFTSQCYDSADALSLSDAVVESFVAWEDHETKSHLCSFPLAAPTFFGLILTIWTFYLMHEMKQTIYFWWHTMALDTPNDGRVTILQHSDNFIITHMGRCLKVWVSVVVFIPKLMIALILWYIGAGWLTATTGIDNLVLNSLALTFICEVDELIFRTCIPEVAKSCLEKTKLPLPSFKYTPTYWMPTETMGTCIGCIALGMAYLLYMQDAIRNYRWDLSTVCDAHRSHLAML